MTMTDEDRLYVLAGRAQQKAIKARQRKANRPCPPRLPPLPAMLSPTQRTGRDGESRASDHLQQQGLTIIARNLLGKTGEIDLVARDGEVLVFIEVRHRFHPAYGGAAASVNREKQLRLIRTAQLFLPRLVQRYFRGRTPACRFDVIGIEPQGLVWIKDAFRE
ncbi:MAG: YraN family protein [Candidimonas sp.]|nr:YraN family protein [Candidimonas sp.]